MPSGRWSLPWCGVVWCLLVQPTSAPPEAERVYFTTGQVLATVGHAVEGRGVRLRLRDGGEMLVDPRLIVRIESDAAPVPAYPPTARVSRPRLPAKPYADIVASASARHGVDSRLVHALIQVESGYRANAHSSKGAMGLMQLMPATAARYAVGNPFDPSANIDAGTRHLKILLEEFGTRGGLAAYNAGEGTVRRFRGIPPYPETHQYVSRVLEIVDAAVVQH